MLLANIHVQVPGAIEEEHAAAQPASELCLDTSESEDCGPTDEDVHVPPYRRAMSS